METEEENKEEKINIHFNNEEKPTTNFPALENSNKSESMEGSPSVSEYTKLQTLGRILGDVADAATPTYAALTIIPADYLSRAEWLTWPNAFFTTHMIEKGLDILVSKESPMTSLKATGFGSKKLAVCKIGFDWTFSFFISSGAAYGFWQINSSIPQAWLVPLFGTLGLGTYTVVSFTDKHILKFCQRRQRELYKETYKEEEKLNGFQIGGKTVICIVLDLAALMAILKNLADAGYEKKDPHVQLFIMIIAHLSRQLLSLSYIPEIDKYFAKFVKGENEENFLTFNSWSQRLGTTHETLEFFLGAGQQALIALTFGAAMYLGVESWCWWGNNACKYDVVNENLPVLGTVSACVLFAKTAYDHKKSLYKGISTAISKYYSRAQENRASFFLQRRSRYEPLADTSNPNVEQTNKLAPGKS